jgi:cysteine sulfinate desulfinase/cysteine desulfurase-like protein
MGLPMERVQGSVRFSLGRATREQDVDRAAETVTTAVAKQRSLAVTSR